MTKIEHGDQCLFETAFDCMLYKRKSDMEINIIQENERKYLRENPEELQYLNLVKDVLETGKLHSDRTGIGRISKFGCSMRFNLENNILPLLTTKKVSFYNIVNELLWMINGQTDSKILEKKGINIWKGNSSRDYLDKNGLSHLDDGDCGAIYGFQWRHFGNEYSDCNNNIVKITLIKNTGLSRYISGIISKYVNYTVKYSGFDQISECVRLIKEDSNSTRIIISGWNPAQLKNGVLPACHTMYQFYVDENKLSCMLTLRSNDLGLGAPYNICSASLLTYMFAEVCGLKPYELVYSIANAHVYSNQVQQLKSQLERTPYSFPKFNFNRKVNNIFDFKYEDFNLVDYKCHSKLEMKMAV